MNWFTIVRFLKFQVQKESHPWTDSSLEIPQMIITPDYHGHCHSKKADLRCCHTKKLTLDVWIVGLGECVCVCVVGGGAPAGGMCASQGFFCSSA